MSKIKQIVEFEFLLDKTMPFIILLASVFAREFPSKQTFRNNLNSKLTHFSLRTSGEYYRNIHSLFDKNVFETLFFLHQKFGRKLSVNYRSVYLVWLCIEKCTSESGPLGPSGTVFQFSVQRYIAKSSKLSVLHSRSHFPSPSWLCLLRTLLAPYLRTKNSGECSSFSLLDILLK